MNTTFYTSSKLHESNRVTLGIYLKILWFWNLMQILRTELHAVFRKGSYVNVLQEDLEQDGPTEKAWSWI
ncbi:hypothetical protein OBV_38880 [Oscillibacter valericigenes Sjm18-20]|nr:hypothetical protein OBV_38880 [Oscillibacter valericigenes Sjm18-20]